MATIFEHMKEGNVVCMYGVNDEVLGPMSFALYPDEQDNVEGMLVVESSFGGPDICFEQVDLEKATWDPIRQGWAVKSVAGDNEVLYFARQTMKRLVP